MTQDYQIKTDVFEGPLELLLDLVEKRKLFINSGMGLSPCTFHSPSTIDI